MIKILCLVKYLLSNKLLLLIVVSLSILSVAFAQDKRRNNYSGRVVSISDGDTFTLLTPEKKQVKVRLAEIDTPESAQPFGTRAKQALSDLIFNKEVLVVEQDTDRYGRLVGHAYVDGIHVNRRMVQEGMAWVYRQYLKDRTLLQDEEKAKGAKKGLWSLPSTEQVPPWEWRRGNKAGQATNKPTAASAPVKKVAAKKYECGSKTKCSEMSSCEEAVYYLKECGLSRLDGDKDGVPCESICN